MNIKASSNVKDFQKSLQLYEQATDKEEPEILNRAGRNVSIQATKETPKAVAAWIHAELTDNHLAERILSARGSFKGIPISQRKTIVRRFINARVRSAAYIAGAGWSQAREEFGARGGKLNPKSEAAKGGGQKATVRNKKAVLLNNARGADKVAVEATNRALGIVGKDMRNWATQRLQKVANKFSAK